MLRCENCGAPLPEPEEGRDYVACTYCQTLAALPKLAAPAAPPPPTPRPLDPELALQASAAARTGIRLLVGVLVLSGAVIVVSVAAVFWNALKPTLNEAASHAAELGQDLGATRKSIEMGIDVDRNDKAKRGGDDATLGGNPNALSAEKPRRSGSSKNLGAPKPSATATATGADSGARPPKPTTLNVAAAGIQIDGDFPKEVVRSKLLSLNSSFRSCYFKILDEAPTAAGTLNMRFTIDPKGNIRGAGASKPSLPINLVSCVNRALLSATMPPPEKGIPVVTFQLRFSAE